MKDGDKKSTSPLQWLWEFSKKVVLICTVLYVAGFFYSCAAMWHFCDFTYLGTFMEQVTDILRTCVFGYFLKAGAENVLKIYCSKKNERSEQQAAVTANDDVEEKG